MNISEFISSVVGLNLISPSSLIIFDGLDLVLILYPKQRLLIRRTSTFSLESLALQLDAILYSRSSKFMDNIHLILSLSCTQRSAITYIIWRIFSFSYSLYLLLFFLLVSIRMFE